MMKTALLGMMIAGLAGFAPTARAAENNAVTLQGEVLDMSCYAMQGAHGKKHAMCARACLAGGAPAGLLTADGGVYLLVDNHTDKKPYQKLRTLGGEEATVTGRLFKRGGIPIIAVDAVAKGAASSPAPKADATQSPMQNFGSH